MSAAPWQTCERHTEPARLITGEGSVGVCIEELQATFVLSVPNIPDAWYHNQSASLVPGATVIRAILLN
jgi:hypothetical protein